MTMGLVDEALQLADRGHHVFPVGADKAPLHKGGYKNATIDPDRLRDLFSHPGAALIGRKTGSPEQIFVVDVDLYKGDRVRAEFERLQTEGVFPPTFTVATRSGGRHLYYKVPEGAEVPRSGAATGMGIEWRGEGGYVVAPPSEGYQVVDDREVVDLPPKLREWLGARKTRERAMSEDEMRLSILADKSPVHDTLNRLAARMASKGASRSEIYAELRSLIKQSAMKERRRERWDGLLSDSSGELERIVSGGVSKFSPKDASDGLAAALLAKGYVLPTESQQPHTTLERPAEPQEVALPEGWKADRELGDLFDAPIPPIDWIVPGVLARGDVTGLAGDSNVGKTRWLVTAAIGLASGDPSIAGLTKPEEPGAVGVMIVSNEERKDTLRRRFKAAQERLGIKRRLPVWLYSGADNEPFYLTVRARDRSGREITEINTTLLDNLASEAAETGAGVIVIDPLVAFLAGANENSATEMSALMTALRRLANRANAAVIFIHHTPKERRGGDGYHGDAGAFRGSGAIYGRSDMALTLTRYEDIPTPRDAAARAAEPPWRRALREMPADERRMWVRLGHAKSRETRTTMDLWYRMEDYTLADEHYSVGVTIPEPGGPARQRAQAASADLARSMRLQALVRVIGDTPGMSLLEVQRRLNDPEAKTAGQWPQNPGRFNDDLRELLGDRREADVMDRRVRIREQGQGRRRRYWLVIESLPSDKTHETDHDT